jgi:hypothetical protein
VMLGMAGEVGRGGDAGKTERCSREEGGEAAADPAARLLIREGRLGMSRAPELALAESLMMLPATLKPLSLPGEKLGFSTLSPSCLPGLPTGDRLPLALLPLEEEAGDTLRCCCPERGMLRGRA